MKKCLALLVLALLFSVVAGSGVASATHSTSDNPPHDFAVGSGHAPVIDISVAFAAQSGPSGENVRGHYHINQSSGLTVLQGPVTCFATAGNRAVLGGPVEDNPAAGVFIIVEDNGNPSELAPDRFGIAGGTGIMPIQAVCQRLVDPGAFVSLFPIDQGNFTVHDAPPADVTSREEGALGPGSSSLGPLLLPSYSPECVEGKFCELRHNGVLGSSQVKVK